MFKQSHDWLCWFSITDIGRTYTTIVYVDDMIIVEWGER